MLTRSPLLVVRTPAGIRLLTYHDTVVACVRTGEAPVVPAFL